MTANTERSAGIEMLRTELYFILAGIVVLVFWTFAQTAPLSVARVQAAALSSIFFWTLAIRGLSMLFRVTSSLIQGQAASGRALLYFLLGLSIKASAVLFLVYLFSAMSSFSAKYFALATIMHLGLGTFFLIIEAAFFNKSK